jgi:hypothetical protein
MGEDVFIYSLTVPSPMSSFWIVLDDCGLMVVLGLNKFEGSKGTLKAEGLDLLYELLKIIYRYLIFNRPLSISLPSNTS